MAVGTVLLVMRETGMRRSVEREVIEVRHVVRIHAVAQRRSVSEAGNQDSG